MMRHLWLPVLFLIGVSLGSTNAQEPDPDYAVQGEYAGTLDIDGDSVRLGIQVIALGGGKFTGVGYWGGLPGDGWNQKTPTRVEEVAIHDGILTFESDAGIAMVNNGVASVKDADKNVLGKLNRVVRRSPTLGKQPPANSTVLFDGTSTEQWEFKGKPGEMTDDGLLKPGTASKRRFGDHKVHIEFLLPYKPAARGQARGNSGIYLQGRYEVQMLDSFGLSGEQNECGGIYSIRKPDQNLCYPPLQWQTYDIEFHAAKYDGDKKTQDAWMTVQHNGVTIHDQVKLPHTTTAASDQESAELGYIYLQDHGNPVRFRNIWVEEINSKSTGDQDSNPPSKPPVPSKPSPTTPPPTTPSQSDQSQSDQPKPNQTAQKLKVDYPVELDYLLYLPKGYDSQEKWPLVLFLHGAGERGGDLNRVKVHGPPKLIQGGKQFPFIVVSPQCPASRWWEPISLSALLDEVEGKYKVDADRIYVTGLSMGGFGTWSLAAHSPERFAAIAPICGGGDAMMVPYTIGDKIPIWVFHGQKDQVVPFARSQSLVDGFKKRGGDVKFTVYPEAGHDSWTRTYENPELYTWLLSHTKKQVKQAK